MIIAESFELLFGRVVILRNMADNKKNTGQGKNSKYITFNIEGDQYDTFANRKFLKRKPHEPITLNLVKAFMPGVVKKIYVKPGDKMKEGSKVLVLEAMKMKNILFAPAAGYVKKINVEEGQMVPKNHVLVELELIS